MMQRVYGIAFAILICTSCSRTESSSIYESTTAGLRLSYNNQWVASDDLKARNVVDAAESRGLRTEGMAEAMSNVALYLVRPTSSGGISRNANIMLMLVPVPAELCSEINTESYVAEDAREYVLSLPNARLEPGSHFALHGVIGYTVSLKLQDRVATQHRYIYCANNHYAVLQSTSSDGDGERAVRDVLSTLVFTNAPNYSLKRTDQSLRD